MAKIETYTAKAVLTDNDLFVIADSAAANATKKATRAAILSDATELKMIVGSTYTSGLLRVTNGLAQLGDFNSDVNSTLVSVDDTSFSIELTAGTSAGRIAAHATHVHLILASYANDAAAVVGGLVTGDLYQVTGTGIVQIVQ